MNAVTAPPLPASAARTASPRILEAVHYLDQCRASGRAFAIVTGQDSASVKRALAGFLAELPAGSRVARVPAPTDSSHGFLEAVLTELGFEPFESTSDDLHRLLNVVLRQGTGPVARTVIVIDDAQDFGPRVFETIRELARGARDMTAPPLLVLAGHAGLNRVLDSRGMASVAQLTAYRFDMATATAVNREAGPAETAVASLVVSLNHEVIARHAFNRERLLIGRGPHSDICIASRFVSRQHALIIRNDDGDWLVDLKSTNGTSVNSRLVRNHHLRDGDVISIGHYRLRYENAAARPESRSTAACDHLSETVVMRSLQAIADGRPVALPAANTPSAA
jgi:hypothetical protein